MPEQIKKKSYKNVHRDMNHEYFFIEFDDIGDASSTETELPPHTKLTAEPANFNAEPAKPNVNRYKLEDIMGATGFRKEFKISSRCKSGYRSAQKVIAAEAVKLDSFFPFISIS